MDLGEWLARNRWHALWELITQLPAASRFRAAMVNDEEVAEAMLDFEDGQESGASMPWAPPLEDYTTQAKLLSDLINDVRALLVPLVVLAGGKAPKVHPVPVPRTALDKVRERRDLQGAIETACLFGFSPEDFA